MSKYSDAFIERHRTIAGIKMQTKSIIDRNSKLALEEYHEAKSLERLKKEIKT